MSGLSSGSRRAGIAVRLGYCPALRDELPIGIKRERSRANVLTSLSDGPCNYRGIVNFMFRLQFACSVPEMVFRNDKVVVFKLFSERGSA